jgi:DNA-binding response OmpR family regulator
MSEKVRIAIVEDTPTQMVILCRLLEKEYAIDSFVSGEAFLASSEPFDAVLLDIEMPGIGGYEACRRFREQEGGQEIPVIFVSAHDTAPERVAAYDAGGDDFVTKPIAVDELRHKLHSAIAHRQSIQELAMRSSDAQKVAFTAMISMGDLGVVIEFLRKSALATTQSAIAARLIAAMKQWGLKGAVQVRNSRNEQLDLSAEGPISPMQASVLEKLRDIGRIFEMGTRAVINYDRVSLLVENLPIEDPEKVGRLRDHLAVLAESADMRLLALDAMTEYDLQKKGIEGAMLELKNILSHFSEDAAERIKHQTTLTESLEQLTRALGTLGLSEIQTGYVEDLIRETQDETNAYFDKTAVSENHFVEVVNRLQQLASADYRHFKTSK